MTAVIRRIRPGYVHYAAFVDALSTSGLPTDDLTDDGRFYAIRRNGKIVGFGGLQGTGADQMIRSVVVPVPLRGLGHGAAVIATLVEQACVDGARSLWLLTTSADRFFAAFGWSAVDRALAPEVVHASRQFSDLCPSSAVLMCRRLP